ncbi:MULTISPECIES: LuxR family transcriptional regulator [unclassified Streptomyces]|uniref:LuxR family transcriptional regulator n=1 Tax=unclassified Streptomyces TaxID=2593676 RepID=UPI002E0F4BFB|nr:LuxR family transcriptional regulator [Streptomyces sp. NBC_01197]WSS49995.1 LuxR family transcriptional regulator [Streptomyces sp. NBC_01180]
MCAAKPVALVPSAKARTAYVELLRGETRAQSQQERSPALGGNHSPDRETIQELIRMGMVSEDASSPAQVSPVDPGIVEARLGSLLRSSALTMLEEARSLTDLLRPLIGEARSASAHGGEPIVRIEGKAAISAIVGETVQQAAKELLTAQPGGGRPRATLATIREQTGALLDRGVEIRTLYQHTAWHDGPTREYVSEVTALGAQVRTLDEFFDRLIIVDRKLAFIPADTERERAVIIREAAVVRFLVEVFERNWQRAKTFQGSRTPNESVDISAGLRETIIRCLIHGDSDSKIAKRIGLSTRAYSSHLAKLKAEFKAESRFQLGYLLGQLAAEEAASGANEAVPGAGGF